MSCSIVLSTIMSENERNDVVSCNFILYQLWLLLAGQVDFPTGQVPFQFLTFLMSKRIQQVVYQLNYKKNKLRLA